MASFAEHCMCPICIDRLSVPVTMCAEGHTACQACLAKWVNTPTANAHADCPTCRCEIQNNGEGIRNRTLENLLNAEVVICPNEKCKWYGAYAGLADHHKTCCFAVISYPCSEIGCPSSLGPRGKLEAHAKSHYHAHDLLMAVSLVRDTQLTTECVRRLECSMTNIGNAVVSGFYELRNTNAEVVDKNEKNFQLLHSNVSRMASDMMRCRNSTGRDLHLCDQRGPVRRERNHEPPPYARGRLPVGGRQMQTPILRQRSYGDRAPTPQPSRPTTPFFDQDQSYRPRSPTFSVGDRRSERRGYHWD